MTNEEKNIFNKLKFNMAASNFQNEITEENTLKKKKEKIFFMKKKIFATACASLVLVSGIVVATNIQKNKVQDRGIGEGTQTAIENGYISEQNKTFINSDNNSNSITIEDFMMDNTTLSTKFLFELKDNEVNLNKVTSVELTDLIVRDEEDRIIYGGNDDVRFKKYCEENNLNYVFTEFNDNYMNCGVSCLLAKKDSEKNSIEIMYNMYTDNYPKSKKLYFSLEKITIIEISNEKEEKEKRRVINGNWEISVDVPEIMYNRSNEYYKFVSCDNKDFEVYSAKVSNTGFELGVIISNIEEPEEYNTEENERNIRYYGQKYEATKKDIYMDLVNPIQVTKYNYVDGENGKASYIENENGEKFYSTLSPTRNARNYFIEGNKFDFYDTFSMTKYNATDRITAVLYYYGVPVTIQLEKIANMEE